MTNLDKHQWEFSTEEKYVIDWLESNGYAVTINKRFITKDKITISKGGHSEDTEIPLGDHRIHYDKIVKLIDKTFKMGVEIAKETKEATP